MRIHRYNVHTTTKKTLENITITMLKRETQPIVIHLKGSVGPNTTV